MVCLPFFSNVYKDLKKRNFVKNAEKYIELAQEKLDVGSGKTLEKGEKEVHLLSELGFEESKLKSVYRKKLDLNKSYIIVENVGDDVEQEYKYYIALTDENNNCIPTTSLNNLDKDLVQHDGCKNSSMDEFFMKTVDLDYKEEIWKYRDSITKVVFEGMIVDIHETKLKFDISEGKNGLVIGYVVKNKDKDYTLYIQSVGKVVANPNSSNLFANFKNLVEIEGLEKFDTSYVEKASHMFYNCSSLEELDLSTLNLRKLKDLSYMFSGMSSLKNLNIKNVTFKKDSKTNHMLENVPSDIEVLVKNITSKEIVENVFKGNPDNIVIGR